MMFRPRCPSAGPMGGEGLALPAGTCSLIKPTIFFAMLSSLRVQTPAQTDAAGSPGVKNSGLFDLTKIEFHGRCTAKNGDRDTHLAFLVVDFFDVAVEVCKRTFLDADHLAHFEEDLGFRFFEDRK